MAEINMAEINMAAAGDYSPIQTPFFWYPELIALMKKLVPNFVFKCQEIEYGRGDDKALGCEYVIHNWSYKSESTLMLESILGQVCELRYVYTHKYTKVMYVVFEPSMYMGGLITATMLCVYDPACKRHSVQKCKCEGCMSKIQINVRYYPDQTSKPNDILKDLEFNYVAAQHLSWGNVQIQQNKIKNRSKRLPKQVIKPYVEMKTNIPDQMLIKDEDYFIESWM